MLSSLVISFLFLTSSLSLPVPSKRQVEVLSSTPSGIVLPQGQPGSASLGAVVVSTNITESTSNNNGVAAVSDSSSAAATSTTSAATSTSTDAAATTTTTEGSKSKDSSTTTTAEKKSKETSTTTSESSKETSSSSSSSSSSSESSSNKGSASNNDVTVLQLANVLELFEATFYQAALDKFSVQDMIDAGLTKTQAEIIVQTSKDALRDEQFHVELIQQTLNSVGVAPFTKCSFNLDALLKSPVSFVNSARSLEMIGVMAYLGATGLIVDNPALLQVAGEIVTIEGRHSTLSNIFNGGDPIPQSLDMSASAQSIIALVQGFLENCTPEDLGFKTANTLQVISTGSSKGSKKSKSSYIRAGDNIEFVTSQPLGSVSDLSCQIMVGGLPQAIVAPAAACDLAESMNGPALVYLTKDSTPLSADIGSQDASIIVAGPALIIVDKDQEVLPSLFNVGGKSIAQLALQETPTKKDKVSAGGKMVKSKSKHHNRNLGVEGVEVLGWN